MTTSDGDIIPVEYNYVDVGAPIENGAAANEAFKEFGKLPCSRAHEKAS